MSDNPWALAGFIAIAAVFFRVWLGDWRAARAGKPHPHAFPGAVPCAPPVIVLAVIGTLVLLVAETSGEYGWGLSGEQQTITVLAGLATLAAAFFEEIVFRGYLVVTRRGAPALWSSVVGFSVLFALIHPFLWERNGWSVTFHPTAKGWFSTVAVFAGSLWFYLLRFLPLNPSRSLVPCIAAHFAKNFGVFAIKAVQGFVAGWL